MKNSEKLAYIFVLMAGFCSIALAWGFIFGKGGQQAKEGAGARRTIPVKALATAAREKLKSSFKVHTLEQILALKDDHIDIAAAALLITKELDPALDIDACLRQLDRIADRILENTPEHATPE